MSRHQITPAWQTRRGPVVQAAGCAEGVPVAGVRVYGSTRQNLWQELSGSSNGISVSTGGDGSLALSGTASATATVGLVVYALKPGKTYTLSVDKAIPGVDTGYGFYVDTDVQISFYVGGNNLTRTFTVSADATIVTIGVYLPTGVSPSGTYRVMLNEGPTAQPWCKPGLSSVSELGVVSAGKNLLPRRGSVVSPSSGLSASVAGDGAISISGTSTGSAWLVFGTARLFEGREYTIGCDQGMGTAMAYFQLYNEFGDLVIVGGASHGNSTTFTPSGTGSYTLCFWTQGAGIKVDKTFRVQLELGTTATAYEPPAVTSTPVDLSGHQLRGLPDGTRDVLTVDGSGAVSVEPWCYDFVLTGEESWIKSESRENSFYITASYGPGFAIGSPSDNFVLCDRLPVVGTLAEFEESTDSVLLYNAASLNIRHTASTLEEFKSWLSSNPVHVVVAARAPFDALTLDPIAPPTVPASDATLWAASDVPCDLEATTWTASGAEQGRQQAAMVALAQQVRQQAETVAALTTQALEA